MIFSLFLGFLFVFLEADAKLVFTGSDVADDIILSSNLTVLIQPHCQNSEDVIKALEKAKIGYNVLQSVILVF